jgi:hypothetical protein
MVVQIRARGKYINETATFIKHPGNKRQDGHQSTFPFCSMLAVKRVTLLCAKT